MAFFGDSLTKGTLGASFLKILAQKLPDDTLLNFGKNGDTIHGLYKRIKRLPPTIKPDLGCIWIGTNDILTHISSGYNLSTKPSKKPWQDNHDAYQKDYQNLLDDLTKRIPAIITLPPILIGEDVNNLWNQELDALAYMIETLSKQYPTVTYFNLRDVFIKELMQKKSSRYLRPTIPAVLFDKIACTTAQNMDVYAQKRGLFFTIDGVHLNTKGAHIVADAIHTIIQDYRLHPEMNP
ncbi:MAG: SGNH/GDSL hydrolase family protein [Candidatus Thermoplasmatota archaeon]